MKKINWLIAVVAVVAAALLVMLYFALGFQHVDNYLDVYLGILWVAIIAVFAGILYWRESVRRRLIRRFYISPATVYNPEFGGARRGCICGARVWLRDRGPPRELRPQVHCGHQALPGASRR